MPSHRPRPLPNVDPAEIPFLSREWMEGELTRPERPFNPRPVYDVDRTQSFEAVDELIASFQYFHVDLPISASDSGSTVEMGSSAGSDSGIHSADSDCVSRPSPPLTPDSFVGDIPHNNAQGYAHPAEIIPPASPSDFFASFDLPVRTESAFDFTSEFMNPFRKESFLAVNDQASYQGLFAKDYLRFPSRLDESRSCRGPDAPEEGRCSRDFFERDAATPTHDLTSFLSSIESTNRDSSLPRVAFPSKTYDFPSTTPPPRSASAAVSEPWRRPAKKMGLPPRPASAFASSCPRFAPSRPSGIPPPIRGSDAFEDMASHRRRCCQFCKNNGERESCYRSHPLKDDITGLVTCPVLRKYVCDICGKSGDEAHTRRYCPENPNPTGPTVKVLQSSVRNSAGKRRKPVD